MTTRRRLVLALMASALSAPLAPFAQQPARIARVGFLFPGFPEGVGKVGLQAFRDGLHELGYVEGKNIQLEVRWGEGKLERMPALAAELVQLNVDVILAGNSPSVFAPRQATRPIPVWTPTS